MGSARKYNRSPPSSQHFQARDRSSRFSSVDLSRSEAGRFLPQTGVGFDDAPSTLPNSTRSSRSIMPFGTRRLTFALVGFIVVLFFLLSSDSNRKKVVTYVNDKAGQVLDKAPWPRPLTTTSDSALDILRPLVPASSVPSSSQVFDGVRQKPVLHPDPLQTTRCPSDSVTPLDLKGRKRPLVQYAIMIDAGSTGSRIHVYKFNYCNLAPELEDEYFEMLQGGLSMYKADAKAAADSLRPLLKSAFDKVPKTLHNCTPITVKATAGLRLLQGEQAHNILNAVRDMLENEYPFPIADGRDERGHSSKKGVEIMEGKDEGVFAWITVNYLLNRIGGDRDSETETAAVMDLGGGSTQIVFQPAFTSPAQGMHSGEHVYELRDFGSRSYTLYQNSYLGYGLMQARMSINSLAAFTYSLAHPNAVRTGSAHNLPPTPFVWQDQTPENTHIPSPCFAAGKTKSVLISQPGQAKHANVTFVGTEGGFKACRRLVQVMMDKDAVCLIQPCSFAGVYQPSLMETFSSAPIIALSYFYDRLTPLGLGPTFRIKELENLADRVCSYSSSSSSSSSSHGLSTQALSELNDRPETCLDITFMHGLLSLGYELDSDREIIIAKKLDDTELGWCLGAQLAVLEEEGVLCKK